MVAVGSHEKMLVRTTTKISISRVTRMAMPATRVRCLERWSTMRRSNFSSSDMSDPGPTTNRIRHGFLQDGVLCSCSCWCLDVSIEKGPHSRSVRYGRSFSSGTDDSPPSSREGDSITTGTSSKSMVDGTASGLVGHSKSVVVILMRLCCCKDGRQTM